MSLGARLLARFDPAYSRLGIAVFARVARPCLELLFHLTGHRSPAGGSRRLLVVRVDGLGDAVLTTAFLRELRRRNPGSEITLLAAARAREFFAACPYVDRLVTLDLFGDHLNVDRIEQWRRILRCAATLWRFRFDRAFDPRFDVDFYMGRHLMFLCGARERIAYAFDTTKAKRAAGAKLDSLLTRVVPGGGAVRHEARRSLEVIVTEAEAASLSLRPEAWPDAGMIERARGVRAGLGSGVLIAMATGALEPKRRWPVARFVELARRLAATHDAWFVVVGGADVAEDRRALRAACGERVLAWGDDLPSISATCALLEQCDLFVGNDSGPLHMASAADVATIEVSCHALDADPEHANSPLRFGPLSARAAVLRPASCRPPCAGHCGVAEASHCIEGVAVAEVAAVAFALLASLRSPAAPAAATRS